MARAQQRGIAVADFELQLRVAAEVAQVVARKGVAQRVLPPASGRGILPG